MTMKEQNKEIPISLKYEPNKPKILENSEEESNNNSNYNEKQNVNNDIKNEKYLINKYSKVYFYCPYNRTYTKFQNYEIDKICDLIKKYQMENYFIIQIDNDNILYEEILKMQFKNESQIIHKMFDLKLDYSFSPFQDSLFFNMSILTDFFYDQIEKYLIQIFFHNHGIYIINKDSCEYIHQIIMDKFIFYFVENSEFFEKSIKDKNNKNKSTKILINDFKLKNIIKKIQEVESTKSNRKSGSISKNYNNFVSKGNRKNGSLRENMNNFSIKNENKIRFSTPDYLGRFNKTEKKNNDRQINIKKRKSLSFIEDENSVNEKKDGNKTKDTKYFSFNINSNNLTSLGKIKSDFNENLKDSIKNRNISCVEKNNNLLEFLKKNKIDKIDKSENEIKDINHITNNYTNSLSNSYSSEKRNYENENFKNSQNVKNESSIPNNFINNYKYYKNNITDKSNSSEREYYRLESFKNLIDKPFENENGNDNTKFYKDIDRSKINNQILNESCNSSRSSKSNIDVLENSQKNNIFREIYDKKENMDHLITSYSKKKSETIISNNNNKINEIKLLNSNYNYTTKNELKEDHLHEYQNRNSEENFKLVKNFTFNPHEEAENENKNNNIFNKDDKKIKNINTKDIRKNKKSITVFDNYSQNINQNININLFRKFSVKQSPRLELIYNFKEYDDLLEKNNSNLNKSHNNLENYSEDLMDLRNKLNELSTNYENKQDQNNNYNNVNKINNEKNFQNGYDSIYNPEFYKKTFNLYQDYDTLNNREYKDSDENKLLNNSKENKIDLNNQMILIGSDIVNDEKKRKNEFNNKIHKKESKKFPNKRINFSTDELIYYLFIFSLEKLEEFTESLVKEVDSLKGIYLELSEKERKDFFRRIHSLEVSMHIIYQETKIKKKFFKFAKNQFRTYNKLSDDFYFKNNFNFFLELMISKITQIELQFETLENFLKMIKENYHIIIEDNTEKENVKLNYVMKVLTILTTIYAPMNIIPGLFGMNVKVPWVGTEVDSTNPFVGICVLLIVLILVQLWAFRKLKWF